MAKTIIYIYKIIHPTTKAPLYVGATKNIKTRSTAHLCPSTGKKEIIALRKKGIIPLIEVIEICTLQSARKREEFWIKKFESEGFKLFNGQKNATYGKNLGRKPVDDKKIHVALYVTQSQIDACGGREFAIEAAYKGIEQEIKQIAPTQ